MLERLLIRALRKGIEDLKDKPERVNQIFECLKLSSQEAQTARENFLQSLPTVIFQYPQKTVEFPVYAVRLKSEAESMKFLDDSRGDQTDLEVLGGLGPVAEEKSSIYTANYSVMVYARHPDQCLYLYTLAKLILVRERDYLKEQGLLDTAFSGTDMVPDRSGAYGAEWLFMRELGVQTKYEFRALEDPGFLIREVRQGLEILPQISHDGA